ncbi:acyclic terpene utilization AtuA family protein [Shimia sp. SDUM112013]|uniref:acyclic terpene utilization AtuA family protein n=1 Tax=Shimia sp. SDUM112013 TaxID=3136160 RepID=UPI0032EC40A6
MTKRDMIRIGGAAGFWGESDMALPQLLRAGGLDFIVFDYLAEVTLSIMARQRAKDPAAGYATDFVTHVMTPNLEDIAGQGVRIISNAGGMNPSACAEALRKEIAARGLSLSVAVVTGDDLLHRRADFARMREMFSGADFPENPASINAYLGAFPIARALDEGADIVITGRCVDSAVTLGACIHAFGWGRQDHDLLSAGSLAGHILECGPQATGGNFTDWRDVAGDIVNIGYPVAEMHRDGTFVCTKPEGTGGQVSVATVGEQMLYEIGNPAAYILPDVVCDFTQVSLEQEGPDRVRVTGARGRAAPATYKVSTTYADGFRAGTIVFFQGQDAADKARLFAEATFVRARRKLRALNAPDFTETLVEITGDESCYGASARETDARDVALKIAARHPDARAAGLLIKEMTGLALATPPGLSLFAGGQSRPSPVVRLFSFLTPKDMLTITVEIDGRKIALPPETGAPVDDIAPQIPMPPQGQADMTCPLSDLAVARSGDKGDKANIGILPRDPAYAPWIWAALDEAEITRRFAHFLQGDVERFFLPGTGAINILLHDVLGGGGMASLRNDPQGKTYAQILLDTPIPIPAALTETD